MCFFLYFEKSALSQCLRNHINSERSDFVFFIRFCDSRDEEDAVIRPLPRVKRILSEPSCLAHVVQLLLTFDPILVEKVTFYQIHLYFNSHDNIL